MDFILCADVLMQAYALFKAHRANASQETDGLKLKSKAKMNWMGLLLLVDVLSCVPIELPCYAIDPIPDWLPLLILPR